MKTLVDNKRWLNTRTIAIITCLGGILIIIGACMPWIVGIYRPMDPDTLSTPIGVRGIDSDGIIALPLACVVLFTGCFLLLEDRPVVDRAVSALALLSIIAAGLIFNHRFNVDASISNINSLIAFKFEVAGALSILAGLMILISLFTIIINRGLKFSNMLLATLSALIVNALLFNAFSYGGGFLVRANTDFPYLSKFLIEKSPGSGFYVTITGAAIVFLAFAIFFYVTVRDFFEKKVAEKKRDIRL